MNKSGMLKRFIFLAAVSVLLALGLWILIRRRDHLFKDTFVPLFINLFFNADDGDESEE